MNLAQGDYSTIAGGGPSNPAILATRNRVTDNYGTVGGGGDNQAGDDAGTTDDATYATVGGGGYMNTASSLNATVAGGNSNTASGAGAAIGGGYTNTASQTYATVGGGRENVASADHATIGGGRQNTASYSYATVGGGYSNTAENIYSTVSGGYENDVWADAATVGGGLENYVNGYAATVPGGQGNEATGEFSFAAGRNAHAWHRGSFVWGDSQADDIHDTEDNQVTFRCLGGVRFRSGTVGTNQTVEWVPGDSSWSFTSDQNLKENFVEIDLKEVLERVSRLPITEWNFKRYSQRHIGPVAQDFHALFPLGGSDTMIDSGDLQGVSLAAIQGLHEIVQEKDAKILSLESRIEALETLVEKLVESQAGGEK